MLHAFLPQRDWHSFSKIMHCSTILLTALSLRLVGSATAQNTNCDCGYYDPTTQRLFTDFLIVYFNETSTLPTDVFQARDYAHKYEKSWNAQFRSGADPANLQISNSTSASGVSGNSSSLELTINPPDPQHLVSGGEIRT